MDTALPIAVKFIGGVEGCSLAPYQDVGGVWTIGYGCTYWNGKPVTGETPSLTQAQADAALSADVAKVLAQVRALCMPLVTDTQAAAFTSFVYNEGLQAFRDSTMLKLFNEGRLIEAAQQFSRWVFVTENGHLVRVQGLVNRRNAERKLFMLGASVNG